MRVLRIKAMDFVRNFSNMSQGIVLCRKSYLSKCGHEIMLKAKTRPPFH